MPVSFLMRKQTLDFIFRFLTMTGIKLHVFFMLDECTTKLVIFSTYITVHCPYNENVQSMCPPTTIHGKYLLCPYIFYLFIKKIYFSLSSFLICRVRVLDTDRINVETKDHHYIY